MPYCDEITNLNNRKWDSFQGPVCIKKEKIRDKSKTGEWIDSPPPPPYKKNSISC